MLGRTFSGQPTWIWPVVLKALTALMMRAATKAMASTRQPIGRQYQPARGADFSMALPATVRRAIHFTKMPSSSAFSNGLAR